MKDFKKYCESRTTVNEYRFEYEDDDSGDEYFESLYNWAELADEVMHNPNKHNKALLSANIENLMEDADYASYMSCQKGTMFLVLAALDNGNKAEATALLDSYHELRRAWEEE